MHQDFPAAGLKAVKEGQASTKNEEDVEYEKFRLAVYTGSLFKEVKVKEIPPGFRKTCPMPKDSEVCHKRFMEALASDFWFKGEEKKKSKNERENLLQTRSGTKREKKTQETSILADRVEKREIFCKTLELPEIDKNCELIRMEVFSSGCWSKSKEETKTVKLGPWRQLHQCYIQMLAQLKLLRAHESKL